MRPIDADAVFPWYVDAFRGKIEPSDVRFSMNDIKWNLDNIPTIEAPVWITCSEKLPDKMLSTYLVTDNEGDVYICGWASGEWVGAPREIIAWMPMPEPYKDGDKE